MFGLSASHLLIIAIVILLFGARRLPELGAGLGEGIRAFKKGLEGGDSANKIAKNANDTQQPPNQQG